MLRPVRAERVVICLQFSFYNPEILRYNRYSAVKRENKYKTK